MPKYIYTNQKVKNTETGEEYPLSSIPSNWVEGQEVFEGEDFKIGWQGEDYYTRNWHDCTKEVYEDIGNAYRRLIAIPIAVEEEVKEDKNNEMLKVAMALVRCGWQMACDEILLRCGDRPTWFTNILIDIMDKEKKRQFDWVKLREEMEKMDIAHLMPKNV